MTSDEPDIPIARSSEPRLIEHARRAGWGLLLASAAAMFVARSGPGAWHGAAVIVAVAAGMLGFLAIINVALVRGLYRQIDMVKSRVSGEE